jgi:hypothetical protein
VRWNQPRAEHDGWVPAHRGDQQDQSSDGPRWHGASVDWKSAWSVHWADELDRDPRLVKLLQLRSSGEVRALASITFDGRPIVAINT